MPLTEIEEHRRLISNEINKKVYHVRKELLGTLSQDSGGIKERLRYQEKAIEQITERLTQLAIYEGELLNASKRLQGKKNKLEELEERVRLIDERLHYLIGRT